MPGQYSQLAAGRRVPDFKCMRVRSGNQLTPIGRPSRRAHAAAQFPVHLPRSGVPDFDAGGGTDRHLMALRSVSNMFKITWTQNAYLPPIRKLVNGGAPSGLATAYCGDQKGQEN